MTDKELHLRFSDFGSKSQKWKHQCKLLLPEVARRQLWKKYSYNSIYEYAAQVAGIGRSTVYETLWILNKLEDKPALKKVAEEKGLTRVRPLIVFATKENDVELAERARTMSKSALEAYRPALMPGHKKNSVRLTLELPVELVEKLKKLGNINELLTKFLEQIKEPVFEEPDPVKTQSRHIPIKIKQHVVKRTNGHCSFPGCIKKIMSLHHTQRFSIERVHDPKRLHGLCDGHERLAHHGLIENEDHHPRSWRLNKKPEKNTAKHWIDQLVALYRPG